MNGGGLGHILGRARKLAASCEDVVTSAELCGDTQCLQAPEDGPEELGKWIEPLPGTMNVYCQDPRSV